MKWLTVSTVLVGLVIALIILARCSGANNNSSLTIFLTYRAVATKMAMEADEIRRNLQQAVDCKVQAERETQEAEDKVSSLSNMWPGWKLELLDCK